MHLPNLKKLDKEYSVYAVMSRTGANTKAAAKQFGARYATTDYTDILKDNDADAVLISTRHNLHSEMAVEAIKSGKHVFVEKPMSLNRKELAAIVSAIVGREVPDDITSIASFIKNMDYAPEIHYMVGFNRRFSPYLVRAKELTSSRINPMIINYRMNAGYIPLDNWVHSEEGGGRNIGEACHIYDIFNFLTGSEVASVKAQSINPRSEQYAKNDNFVAIIKYLDGSVCNLTYTSLGSKDYPKEHMEIYCDEKIFRMNDFRNMEIYGLHEGPLKTKIADKGHFQELQAFSEAIKKGKEAIFLWQQVQATEISFKVEEQISRSHAKDTN
jgi:predicted dehydrogenase